MTEPGGANSRKAHENDSLPVVLYLAPWAFVILASLKLKHRLLANEGGGYDFLAELLGVGNGNALTVTQRLALYRLDVLVSVVIGGILFLGLMRLTPSRARASIAWITCTVLFLIFYAQLKSWWEVGTFISANLMAEGLFGAGQDLISEYASSATVQRLFLSLAGIAVVCVVLAVLERRATSWKLFNRLQWTYWPLAIGAAVLVIASWTSRVPATPFDRPATTASLVAFAGRADFSRTPPNLVGATPQDLLARYARLANAPVPNGPSEYFGKARGYDVVFMMLESLPDVCYGVAMADSVMPNMSRLEQRAIVPSAHYSTYPYSRRAYMSIFTSWYPLSGIRDEMARFGGMSRDLRAPGVVHSAAITGYETAAFVPERPVGLEEDELRYEALGFASHEVPPSAFDKPEGYELNGSQRDWVRLRDRQSFDHLKERAAKAIDAKQRYLFSFNPQLTHGPWPGLTSESTREETCRAGAPLFSEVDGMVGELLALLKEKNRADSTLIVIMGDHGLRTRREYPPFHGGTLDDVTFHVPLVLYAPGVVKSTVRIPWMTSHIDIAPSILDLLGITVDRDLEMGSPMWDPRVANRATYFFAKGYFGFDGYQRDHQAIMVRYLYGGVSRSAWNGTLRFNAADLLRRPDESTLATVDELTLMGAIQGEIAKTLLPGENRLSRPPAARTGGSGAIRASRASRTVPSAPAMGAGR